MDRILRRSLLFDFYGELLTEHQKSIYEQVVMDDCSLAEVADAYGISRQGVHDIVKRCERTMLEYEEKLKLVEKFLAIQKQVEEIETLVKDTGTAAEGEILEKLRAIPEIL